MSGISGTHAPPTTAWEKTDVAGRILLGVAGLCLSAVLAWGEYEDRGREVATRAKEAATRAEEAVRLKGEGYAREFQTYYAMARQARSGDEFARTDLDLASAMAQTLAAPPFEKQFYTDAIVALRASRLPPPSVPSAGGTSAGVSPIGLQVREAVAAPNVTRSSDQWFAVIATYSLNPTGLRLATERARSVPASLGCAEVWRTILSRNYAVVVGGMTGRASALANAGRARALGLAPDAFTQANRQWVRQVGCQPLSILPTLRNAPTIRMP
jgi:hypothetical protein